MSKKLLTALLVAVLVVLAMAVVMMIMTVPRVVKAPAESSAEESLEDAGMLIVPSDMPEGITIEVPDTYEEAASEYYKKYYVKNDASIIVTGEKMEFSYAEVDSYTDSVILQYQEAVDDFQLVSDEDIEISGSKARLLEFTYAIVGSEDRQDFECTTAVMMRGDRVYLVTCKSHYDTYPNYREEFRMILNSIRLSDVAEDDGFDPEEYAEYGEMIDSGETSQPDEAAEPADDSVQP